MKFKINDSTKVGINEIVGLKKEMIKVFKPIVDKIKSKVYWDDCEIEYAEYTPRPGFIPYSHNHGGLILDIIIPKWESYQFSFLDFGSCDGCNEACTFCLADLSHGHKECISESEGHLDAKLRIFFKFEGFDEKGKLNFFINVCGGNDDAPYFRLNNLTELFEAEFSCKNIKDLSRSATKHINKLLKVLK